MGMTHKRNKRGAGNTAPQDDFWTDGYGIPHPKSEGKGLSPRAAFDDDYLDDYAWQEVYTSTGKYGGAYSTGKFTGRGIKWVECHTGNHQIYTSPTTGGSIYLGGWTRGAMPMDNWHVIDLREDYETRRPVAVNSKAASVFSSALRSVNYGGYLSLPIKDFGVPPFDYKFWLALARDVQGIIERGESVLIACVGGHGRTGMVAAILLELIDPSVMYDPIDRVRKNYCEEAVETAGQERYIYTILAECHKSSK
jgi:protein-tyrosine phosphatase